MFAFREKENMFAFRSVTDYRVVLGMGFKGLFFPTKTVFAN
jgi:hypothetical protein